MSRPQKYTKEDCKQALLAASENVEGSLTKTKYRETTESGPGEWAIRQRFGSWNEAKNEAGLDLFSRNLSADYGYFSDVSTPEQAYWVGFILGDGSVAPNGNGHLCLAINLNERDRHIIEEFRDAINSEHSISESGDEVRIALVNDEITTDLRKLGVDEAKTHSSSLPDFDKPPLRSAFVRGLGDADAHCQKSRYSITGANKERFQALAGWLPVEAKVHSYSDNKHRLRVTTHERVQHLRTWLYPDGERTTPALSRKKKEMFSYNYNLDQ